MPVLGIIELIFFGFFFVLMVIGTALDRRYSNESPKWWILGLGLAIAVVYFWGEVSWTGMVEAVQSWSFWKPLAIYLVAGLAYSALEFILSVRKMARSHTDSWKRFISTVDVKYLLNGDSIAHQWVKQRDGKFWVKTSDRGASMTPVGDDNAHWKEVQKVEINYRDIFKAAQAVGSTEDQRMAAQELFLAYVRRDDYRLSNLKKDFISLELNETTFEVQPAVNRARLASFIGAWTFLWPAYAVSLVLGDFLVEVFRVVGDIFSKIGGRFVRFTFADVFKV